ncbi:unnamed protein product [Discosporangium mesarthrocarpum]
MNNDYVTGIADLRDVGVEVLCYVATGFGETEIDEVTGDMDVFDDLYPGQCDGVFLDEGPSSDEYVFKYEEYYQYVQDLFPGGKVVVNPGVIPDESLYHISDGVLGGDVVIVSCENSYQDFGQSCAISSDLLDVPHAPENSTDRYQNSILVHGTTLLDDATLQTVVEGAYCGNWGYIFITDDSLPNPWDDIPTYLPDLVSASLSAHTVVCPTPAPTLAPSQVPTLGPSSFPTPTPTLYPTGIQTPSPTKGPVEDETPSPTPQPRTPQPTLDPELEGDNSAGAIGGLRGATGGGLLSAVVAITVGTMLLLTL